VRKTSRAAASSASSARLSFVLLERPADPAAVFASTALAQRRRPSPLDPVSHYSSGLPLALATGEGETEGIRPVERPADLAAVFASTVLAQRRRPSPLDPPLALAMGERETEGIQLAAVGIGARARPIGFGVGMDTFENALLDGCIAGTVNRDVGSGKKASGVG
jgi:hypothetical protein